MLANIEAWVERFCLANAIHLNVPVQLAREVAAGWQLFTPHGVVHARHLVAATGAHNTPMIPTALRTASVMSHIRGTERLGHEVLTHRLNPFDLVEFLAFQEIRQAFRQTLGARAIAIWHSTRLTRSPIRLLSDTARPA